MKILFLLFGLLIPSLGFAQNYTIDWYKIAGGGGTSTGGLTLSAAPSASRMPAAR
jgi:hypothetical protein